MKLLAAMILIVTLQDPPDLRELIEKLRSDSIDERDRAGRAIKEFGEAAIRPLENAAKGTDAELSARAGHLLRALRIRLSLTPALLKARPGIDERLAEGGDLAWTEEFHQALERFDASVTRDGLDAKDLEPLGIRALRGARTPKEKQILSAAMARLGIRSTAAPLVALLDDESAAVRATAARALGILGAPEAVEPIVRRCDPEDPALDSYTEALARLGGTTELKRLLSAGDGRLRASSAKALAFTRDSGLASAILPLLKDRSGPVRAEAAATLGRLALRTVAADLLPLLRDPFPPARRQAARALGHLAAEEAKPDLRTLLTDGDASVRAGAAEALALLARKEDVPALVKQLQGDETPAVKREAIQGLATLRAPEAVPELIRILRDPAQKALHDRAIIAAGAIGAPEASAAVAAFLASDSPLKRGTAIAVLTQLGDADHRDAIAKLLEDADGYVRGWAATALGRMGDAGRIGEIARLLSDKDANALRGALEALGDLGARDRIPEIAAGLTHDDPLVRSDTLRCLGRLKAAGERDRVAALLRDRNEQVRLAAARCLCRLGSLDGADLLLSGREALNPFNDLRDPSMTAKLEGFKPERFLEGTRQEIVEAMARATGFSVAWPERLPEAQTAWLQERVLAGDLSRLQNSRGAAFLSTVLGGQFAVVVDPAALRILPREEALRFWKEWVAERRKK